MATKKRVSKKSSKTKKIVVRIPKPSMIDIKKIIPNPKNVKQHTPEQIHDIAELMKMVGFKDPIVIDKKFMIWAGHGRLEAAKLLGMTKVPCIFLEGLTKDQLRLFLLMDNKVNESPWIAENVKIVYDEIKPFSFKQFEMNFDDYFELEPDRAEEEWTDMPEFDQHSTEAYQRIVMNFIKKEDVAKFSKLIKQNITPRTRSMWYPPQPLKKKKEEYTT